MKKFFSAIFLMAFIESNSQVHLGLNAGYSVGKSPTLELAAGYDFGVINIQGGFICHLSNLVDQGALFNVKAGHPIRVNELLELEPAIGYATHYKSSDRKELNTSGMMYSLSAYKSISHATNNQIVFSLSYSQNITVGAIGLRVKLF